MMNQQITKDPPKVHVPSRTPPPNNKLTHSSQSLLQVLSNAPSAIVLQEAAAAKDATVDALIARFEDITPTLKQGNASSNDN